MKTSAKILPRTEWPYEVPENWVWTRLGDMTSIIGGGTPSSTVKEYYASGTIPWISPADLSDYSEIYISHGKKMITPLGLAKSSARMLPKDTVCLSTRAPIGYVVIAANELCTNQGFKSFLPSDCYAPKYLYWFLKGNKETLEAHASGTTFLELSTKHAGMIQIPLAPLPEQQRIIARIESLFAKLDAAAEKIRAALDQFPIRKAAILHKAFTGELTKKWREENGVGMESWKETSIGSIFDVFSGKGFKEKEYQKQGVKLLRISNVTYNALTWEDTKYLPLTYIDTESQLVMKNGDIVIALNRPITNEKLKVSLINTDEKMILYQRVGCLRTKSNNYNPKFLLLNLLRKDFLNQVKNHLQGSDQPYINIPPLKKLEITICSTAEQEEIVRILDAIFEREQTAKETAERLLERIALTKKSILARAFRGKLGTNDPNEESAERLLQ